MSTPDDPRPPIEIDDTEDRMGSVHELDFSERRVRALEGVVQYRPEAVRGAERRDFVEADQPAQPSHGTPLEGFVPAGQQAQGDGTGRRRRRRRRGRRGQGNQGASGALGAAGASGASGAPEYEGAGDESQVEQGFDDGLEDDGEEMELGGFNIPEPLESADNLDEPQEPQEPQEPGSEPGLEPGSDDDLQ